MNRAVSREIPTGNSREFPEKSCSRKFPGIISGSREFSGNFYVLWRGKALNFPFFKMFFFWFRSSFTVEKNTIHAENHWNSSMNCIFLRIGVFLSFYKVSFKVPGNSREFPDWFREIPVPGNENLSGNRPPYLIIYITQLLRCSFSVETRMRRRCLTCWEDSSITQHQQKWFVVQKERLKDEATRRS